MPRREQPVTTDRLASSSGTRSARSRPRESAQAHAPNEITWKKDLVTCAAVYVAAVNLYDESKKTDDVAQFRAGKTNNDIQ